MPQTSDHTQIKREAGVLFERYLASSPELREELHAQLLEKHITPLFRSICRRVLGTDVLRKGGTQTRQDEMAQDAFLDAYLAMNRKLERWSAKETPPKPEMFLNYAAMVAYNAIKKRQQMLRRVGNPVCDPQLQVFWLLTRYKEFAQWQSPEGLLCGGYRAWQEEARSEASAAVRDALRRDAEAFALAGLAKRKIAKPLRVCSPVEWMMAFLDQAEAPLEFSALVAAFAELAHTVGPSLQEISVPLIGSGGEDPSDPVQEIPDASINADETTEEEVRRVLLRRLWEQILQLPLNQRKALLLNFPETDIRTLPPRGIAGFDEIAEALEKSQTELAGVWNRLPLDDAVIAAELVLTEPQVKNLRQSAYRTLSWRMRPFRRGALNQLWQAATRLTPQRCAIFMLYVRDRMGASLLVLLPREGYANRRSIADHFQLPLEVLDQIWPELPLGFSRIAQLLAQPPVTVAQRYIEARAELQSALAGIQDD